MKTMGMHGIIGDRKKGKYDPTLADRMNREADDEARREALEARLKPKAEEPNAFTRTKP